MSPEDGGVALAAECGVARCDEKVEVAAPPADFFIRFRHEEDCSCVVYMSYELYISGASL